MTKRLEPKELSRPAKVAMVHALRDLGISVRNIANNLGISKGSVELYLKENPDTDWDDFRTAIREAVMMKEEELASLTLDAMFTVVPEANLGDLTRLYTMLRTLRLPKDIGAGVPVPAGGIHFHRHEKIAKIIERAEAEVEEQLRKEIKAG